MIKYCPNCAYDLSKISVSEVEVPQNRLQEPVGSLLDEYDAQPKEVNGIEVAQPTRLDNKRRLLNLARRPEPIVEKKRMDGELDQFGDLIVGEGLQQEY